MKYVYLLLFCLCVMGESYGQYQIQGKVCDNKGQALSDINVLLYTAHDTSYYMNGTATDLSGMFSFVQLKTGNYKLVFSMLGYTKKEVLVKIENKDIQLDTIEMQTAAWSLDEIVVKADLVSVFGNKETRLFSAEEKKRAVSGLELMQEVPYLLLNNLNKKLQTANGGSVLILCDGVKTDEVDLMGLKPENILKVEFFAQPPARYADLGVEAVLNVVTRRVRGGYVMGHLENGFTTGFGTNFIQTKYSEGSNDFTLRYFIDYRRLSKYKLQQSYAYILNKDEQYQIEKKGSDVSYIGQYHKVEGTFARVKPENYLLSIKARLAVNPLREVQPQQMSGIRENLRIEDLFSNTNLKTNYLSPNLDLYYSKTFTNNQELILNVVNTYYHSESDRHLSQKSGNEKYEALTRMDNKSYSLISELVYSKRFNEHQVEGGIKHFLKILDENYQSNINENSHQSYTLNNLYAYLEMSGRIKRFGYAIGLGGEQSWIDAEESKKYFVLKPNLTLSYHPTKHSSLKLRSTIRSYVPDISLLTNNPIYLDSVFISQGNPRLKPYYDFSNRLLYTFTLSSFYGELALRHSYIHQPYYTLFNDKGSFVEKTYENIDQMTVTGGEFYLSWSPFKWMSISPYYEIDYQRAKVGIFQPDHWYHIFDVRLSASYKNVTFTGIMILSNKSLAGEVYTKEKNYYSADLTWKKERLSITGGILFLNAPAVTETVRGLAVYYRESKIAGDFKGLVYLQLVYTLPFGKKIQRSVKQQLNNTDNDSGIYIDSKVKM